MIRDVPRRGLAGSGAAETLKMWRKSRRIRRTRRENRPGAPAHGESERRPRRTRTRGYGVRRRGRREHAPRRSETQLILDLDRDTLGAIADAADHPNCETGWVLVRALNSESNELRQGSVRAPTPGGAPGFSNRWACRWVRPQAAAGARGVTYGHRGRRVSAVWSSVAADGAMPVAVAVRRTPSRSASVVCGRRRRHARFQAF